MKRLPVSKRTRFEVFKRDGFTCQYCGATPPNLLEVDHIHPVVEGGTNDTDNLITSCQDCNRGKGAVPLDVVPKSLAERASEVEEREAQIAAYSAIMEAARDRLEDDAWRVAEVLHPGASEGYSIANLTSIKRFLRELSLHDVLDAAEMAAGRHGHGRGGFKYFCGICWNWIRDGRS